MTRIAAVVVIALAACVHPHAPEDTDTSDRELSAVDPAGSAEAYAALVALTTGGGTWQAELDGKTSPAAFELASNGHSVVQHSGYLTVFQVVRGAVEAAVFPDDGYLARYRSTDASKTRIEMRWIETINSQGFHAIDHLTIDLRGPDEVVEHWGTGSDAFDVTLRRRR